MFSSYEFSFAGESSLMYGLMLYDFDGHNQEGVSFGNKASIIETRVNSRITPIHYGVNYNENPLEFKLVFGAESYLDRYAMEDVSMWLTGHQDYQWLTIDQPDMDGVFFKCLITSLTPLYHEWLPIAFEAVVQCDCPYAYGAPFEKSYLIDGTTSILFSNESSVREYLKPVLEFTPSPSTTEITIINHSDGDRTFTLSSLPSDIHIKVDCDSGIIQETVLDSNLYSGFNLNHFRFVPGDNSLEVTGDGQFTISGRFLRNVAG